MWIKRNQMKLNPTAQVKMWRHWNSEAQLFEQYIWVHFICEDIFSRFTSPSNYAGHVGVFYL